VKYCNCFIFKDHLFLWWHFWISSSLYSRLVTWSFRNASF